MLGIRNYLLLLIRLNCSLNLVLRGSSATSIFSIWILSYLLDLINFVLCNCKNRPLISTDSEHLFVILNIYLATVRERTTTCSLLCLRSIWGTWSFRRDRLLIMICIILHRSRLYCSFKFSSYWLRRSILDYIRGRGLSILVFGGSINLLSFDWNRPLRSYLFIFLLVGRDLWWSWLMWLIAHSLFRWFSFIIFEWCLTILWRRNFIFLIIDHVFVRIALLNIVFFRLDRFFHRSLNGLLLCGIYFINDLFLNEFRFLLLISDLNPFVSVALLVILRLYYLLFHPYHLAIFLKILFLTYHLFQSHLHHSSYILPEMCYLCAYCHLTPLKNHSRILLTLH